MNLLFSAESDMQPGNLVTSNDESTAHEPRRIGRMPALDSLRGIAIAAVLIYHGIGREAPPNFFHGWERQVAAASLYGTYGVTLFFVLSGFLISGNLIDSKRKESRYYTDFYLRRVLRIMPVYLLMLGILVATSSISLRYLCFALLYLTNVSGLYPGDAGYGPLWSLAVEEQFYLLWPAIVRWVSLKRLVTLCLVMVVLSPLLRMAVLVVLGPDHNVNTKTPFISDSFAIGALLAIALRSPEPHRIFTTKLALGCLAGGLAGAIVLAFAAHASHAAPFVRAFELTPIIFMSAGGLMFAVMRPQLARTTVGRALAFLGEISYGLYLVHQFILDQYDKILGWQAHEGMSFVSVGVRFASCMLLSVILATVSRFTFEKYFLGLKSKLATH